FISLSTFFFQAEDGIRDFHVTGVQTCALPISWFSPDCRHYSRAKGVVPRSKAVRSLAWVVVRWAALVRPRVIILENVEEFATWEIGRASCREKGDSTIEASNTNKNTT